MPSGSFIPVFKIGGALGRATGELMHLALPTGIAFASERLAPIIPGGYAIVGAAAFAGAVTHSISVSVIVFEVTGKFETVSVKLCRTVFEFFFRSNNSHHTYDVSRINCKCNSKFLAT